MNAPNGMVLASDELEPASHSDASTGVRPLIPPVRQLWAIIRRHLWLAAGIVALAIIASILLTFLATPQYTAMSRLEVSRQTDNVTNVEGVQREETSPSLEFYATQYSLLDTRSLAQRVAKRLNLARSEEFFEAHGESIGGLFDDQSGALSAEELRERERETVDLLLENVTVAPIRGSALIDLMYTSANPVLSTRIANTWAEEFAAQTQDRRYASTADARAFLEGRLAELRQRLETSERELVNYANQQNIVRLGESRSEDGRTRTTQTLASRDLETLNAALTGATAERIAAEAQLQAVARNSANAQSVANAALNQMRERRAELQAQYADLLVRFEPEYPAARALQQQIQATDAAIGREEGRVRQSVRTTYEAAAGREQALQQRVDRLLSRFTDENRASIQYNIYQREVDTTRELYDALLQRYKEIGVTGVGSSNISIVDRATVPEEPSSPNLLLNLALALLLGGVIAIAVVVILENLDEGIRDPEQLRASLKRPVLGVIPYIEEGEEPLERLRDPKSELSEAYMTLRTNLGFSTSQGVPKTFAITSSQPAEGKSTTAYALAYILARGGRNVALMDLDMRRPMIDRMIGEGRNVGASNYLAGDDNVETMLQPTDTPGLTVISAGPIPPNAAELLNGNRLEQLVETLSSRFEHVIIDSAPVLGLSDAPLLARVVDGMVFVVQSNETSARSARFALDRLAVPQARILGTVLTKFRVEDTAYGQSYGYGYRYGTPSETVPST